MSAFLRIRCRGPIPRGPLSLLPDLGDVEVLVVDGDGSERAIDCAEVITWSVRPGEVTRATIEFVGVEIDAVAVGPSLGEIAFAAWARSTGMRAGWEQLNEIERSRWEEVGKVAGQAAIALRGATP